MKESVIYQEIVKEARDEGLQEGIQQGIQQVALNLLQGGISVEQVANFTGLSLSKVQELQQNNSQ